MPANDETRKDTLTQKLTKGLKRNVMATVNLTASITTAFKQQGDIAKTFISTGNRNAISSNNLSTTFSTVGLSLNETLSNFQAMSKVGIDITSKGNRDLFARYTILGADTRGLSKMMALNEQTLGLSNQRSQDLGDSLLETAAANGFHSDVLVQALNSLAQTFIRASAVYGKETSVALQEATRNLIGKYGAGNAELVKEMTSKLFAGTAQSTKMAAMLGIDINKLATQDSAQAQAVIEQAISAIGNRIGGAAGQGSSGFAVSKLLEAFGATPGMLALANLGPVMGQAAVDSAETLANQKRQADLQSSLHTIMKDFTIAIVPTLNLVAWFTSKIAGLLTFANGLFGKMLAGAASMIILFKSIALFTKLGAFFSRIGAIASLGLPGKIAAAAALTGAAIGGIIAGSTNQMEETQDDILEESKKQTAALTGESSTAKILGNISLGILQSNILNEQILINAQEHLEKTTEIAETPSVTSPAGNEWDPDIQRKTTK